MVRQPRTAGFVFLLPCMQVYACVLRNSFFKAADCGTHRLTDRSADHVTPNARPVARAHCRPNDCSDTGAVPAANTARPLQFIDTITTPDRGSSGNQSDVFGAIPHGECRELGPIEG